MSGRQCPFCHSALSPRARFCPSCGKPLPTPSEPPVEAGLASGRQVRLVGERLDLHELRHVVEASVRWWQQSMHDPDALSRERAAAAIEELSQILHSLSRQIERGQQTVQITKRLPTLRLAEQGCPTCAHTNRAAAKFCLRCGTVLSGTTHAAPPRGIPMTLRLLIAARTHPGRIRPTNQDSVAASALALNDQTTAYLCLVADGMGGAKAGEYASRVATEVTRAYLQRELRDHPPQHDRAWQDLLRKAVLDANQKVYQDSRADQAREGMGTTLTIALVVGDRVHIASVGDSRLYLFNQAGVTDDGAPAAQLTSDHSLVARLVDIGQLTPEEARVHPQRNILYRSIGTDPTVEVDTRSEQLEPGDVMVICSDGLVNHVSDTELMRVVLSQPDPDLACEQLVALANAGGGRDNISVVVVRVTATERAVAQVGSA
ncbi:MAG: protein phosphatase 2C domain-containing protein [Roseiflexaceae bacterium]